MGGPRRLAHQAGVGALGSQRQRRQHVGAEIDGENLDDGQRQRNPEQHEGQIGKQFGNVRGQDIGQEFADVFEDCPPFLDGIDDAGEIVVEQDHVGRRLGHIGSGNPHGDADVRTLQGWRVVHPVSGDGDDFALVSQRIDHQHLLLGGDPGEQDLRAVEGNLQLRRGQLAHRFAEQHGRLRTADQPDFAGDGEGGMRMVAGHHDHLDASRAAARHGLGHLGPRRVVEADETGEDKFPLRRDFLRGQLAVREGQHPQP